MATVCEFQKSLEKNRQMALACENSYFRLDKKKESKLRFRQKQELNSHNHTCDKNQDNFFIAYFKRFCYSYSRATIISK